MKVLLTNPATVLSIDENHEKLFIKAGSRWPWTTVRNKKDKNCVAFFPFYLAYSANVLRDRGYDVQVIDGVALNLADEEFIKKVKQIVPDVLVIETTTHAANYDIQLSEKIKSILPKTKIVFTGPHVTVFAREILSENKAIDFITLGEYELTLADLVDRLAKKSENYKLDGLAYKKGNEVWVSENKGFIEDIDSLPYPAFELFPTNDNPNLEIYGDGICTYYPAVTLHSSRGCPFKCDFCLWNQVMYDNKKYRMFSPKRVVDEIEYVINNFGAKEIYFDDDDFCVNKRHVLEICDEIKRRNIKTKWSCMGDAMCTDEEMISSMASAGCIFMKFGVESGDKNILKKIGKPLNPEKAVAISKLCRKYKIRTHATFTFGLDGETPETMKATLRLANRIKFDYAQASITTPFPGTRYYDKLVELGRMEKVDWDKFDGTNTCVFNTDLLTSKEIEDFRKKAIRSMILHKIVDPVWVYRYLQRNVLLIKSQGLGSVISPFKALYYTFKNKSDK